MPDYIYLLENRLSANQQDALRQLRTVARDAGIILFLTGDAVRDLTSGHAVRDLEVAVHGNALKLKKAIEKTGGKIWGEDEPAHTLYLCFRGSVRVDLVSTHRNEYPKPGKPVYHSASIQEDLRRRDFTVNAMAISLNEGSYGLLMDPLNGAADIEARTLRLVSNYGFLEEPSLLIRASRYRARLGWDLDPRTQTRYDNAREEGGIAALSAHARSYELEQIGHEDDGLKVLRALEADGWMKVLFAAWTSAKADEDKLKALHDLAGELNVQGVHPNMSAAQMQLLTAKLSAKDLTALKREMVRPGFVAEWNSLDAIAAAFQKTLLARENQLPSATFKLFTSYDPKAVLWLGFTSNTAAVKERYERFLKVWPEARQRIPHVLLQEMRITPELPAYHDVLRQLFLAFIDGKLTTPEEQKAFLEPFSPPAPPPPVTIKRSRAKRGAEKIKERSFEDDEAEESADDDLDDMGMDDDETDLGLPKGGLDDDHVNEADEEDSDEAEDEKPVAVKRGKKDSAPKAGKEAPKTAPKVAAKPVPAAKQVPAANAVKEVKPAHTPKPIAKPEPKAAVKAAPKPAAKPAVAAKPAPPAKKAVPGKATKAAPVKATPAKAAPAKTTPAKAVVKKAPAKPAHKPAPKPTAKKKPSPKPAAKPAAKPTKPAPKKALGKPARKH
ncbi:MAG TPA: CCA tRNA nucleotidyltransferase [Terracidiphilus sp.]|jgi:tRNA nucleotidyltransferase/poly(A) polymerase|nr:CCA tRNA nucleotidyltransferase [Terracidiphilus sp.]